MKREEKKKSQKGLLSVIVVEKANPFAGPVLAAFKSAKTACLKMPGA
jgi:hypothetical protein